MQKSKQLLKFEKEFTLSVKIAYSQLRRAGSNNASYAKVQEMVWDLVFAEKDDWTVISTITAFKKLSIEEQVLMKLQRPEIVVAKKWDRKK
jgi:hypothetical protein